MATMSFCAKMHLEHEWKYYELLWESPQHKEEAIKSGKYNVSAAFFYDVDKADDGRIFITAVRDEGVPVGLLTVTEKRGESGPLLRPYPDWSWYKDDCKGITGGVYNIEIKCNHLFLVDDGRIGFERVCTPRLMIFDLSTNKLVKRVIIPFEIAYNKTTYGLLSSVAVLASHCQNIKDEAVVFMADVEGAGLIVYNGRTSKMCRVESDLMKMPPDPTFELTNETYLLADTIHGLAIIDTDLYYARLSGNAIHKVDFQKLIECSPQDINQANKETQSQLIKGPTTMLASDRCALFFTDITKTSIMCIDAKKFNTIKEEVIVYDPKLEFASGLKVRHGELLVLTNRYHIHLVDKLNLNEINFRFLSIPITEIQKNTNCYSSCKN